MFGHGRIARMVVGKGLSLDLSGIWESGEPGEVYASLHPGAVIEAPCQRLVLAGEGYRRMVYELVREDLRESVPKGFDGSHAMHWGCDIDEMPALVCRRSGTTVFLPEALCEECGVAEGTLVLARKGTLGSVWIYPRGACGSDGDCVAGPCVAS